MPPLSVYARLEGGPLTALREEVRGWEKLGVTGLVVSDHLFEMLQVQAPLGCSSPGVQGFEAFTLSWDQ